MPNDSAVPTLAFRRVLSPRVLALAVFTALRLAAATTEYQVSTTDGQVVRGEYLGTEREQVRLRTQFGIVQIPQAKVQSMNRVGPAGATGAEAPAPDAERPRPKDAPPPPPTDTPRTKDAPAPAAEKPKDLKFREPPKPDLAELVALRSDVRPPPEPSKAERQEIFRLIRNFAETNPTFRKRSIKTLQGYGRTVYPFIAPAYTAPQDLPLRIELLEVLSGPGNALAASIFSDAHRQAQAAMDSTAANPPPPPPQYETQRDRQRPIMRAEYVRMAADDVLRVEGYASTAGGPFNALFLLDTYRKRYGGHQTEPLLSNLRRDVLRLGAAGADAKRANSAWTPADKIMLAEMLLPLLFNANDDLKDLPKELLKKILPTGHPKWDDSETDWVEWFEDVRSTPRQWK